MQISQIVLYSQTGKTRTVHFHLGALNVVTGISASGKSALLHIVEYCLGRGTSTVPEGVISGNVDWFAVLLQLANQQVFIARRKPREGHTTSTRAMLELGREIVPPSVDQLTENIDTTALREQLGRLIGIGEYQQQRVVGSFRTPQTAGLGQASLLCFQGQGEIANQNQLFHRQNEEGIAQALRDTLPYFLGAVAPDQAVKRVLLQEARRNFRRAQEELVNAQRADQGFDTQVQALLDEAYGAGLIQSRTAESRDAAITILRNAVIAGGGGAEGAEPDDDRARRRRELEAQRFPLRRELREVADQKALLLEQAGSEDGYEEAVELQVSRLRALEIIPRPSGEVRSDSQCPACGQEMWEPDPLVQDMQNMLTSLRTQLDGVQVSRPRRAAALRELEARSRLAIERLRALEDALTQLVAGDRLAVTATSTAEEQAFRRGRIDALLSRLRPSGDVLAQREAAVAAAAREVDELEAALDLEVEREELTSRLNVIGELMRDYAANRLGLEHSEGSIRLDLHRLTVVVDTGAGPIPLLRVGSAANWVGYHLATHLALHKFFVEQARPVPRFLMLDQPTQAYFPSEREQETGKFEAEEDLDAVRRLFELMQQVVQELTPNFQVIVCDHANLDEEWFQEAVGVNNWRNGVKLVPLDWIDE